MTSNIGMKKQQERQFCTNLHLLDGEGERRYVVLPSPPFPTVCHKPCSLLVKIKAVQFKLKQSFKR